MNSTEIIEELAGNRVVEEIVSNISKRSFPYTDELCQDLYLDLLMKSPEMIENLYDKGELKYFIVKMARNNLLSRNSPYYMKYGRWNERKSELTDDIKDNLTE